MDSALLDEQSAWTLCERLGVRVPRREYLRRTSETDGLDLDRSPGGRVVVKLVSGELPHKSDLGGVEVIPKDGALLRDAVAELFESFSKISPVAVAVHEFIERERGVTGELLLGLRLNEEFGPIVTLGLGGLDV